MATGGSETDSVDCGSEAVANIPCSVCIKESKQVEATKFCVDCQGNLCPTCVTWHGRFAGTSAHQLVAVVSGSQSSSSPLQLPTEKCQEHGGKVIDTYCPKHEAICCTTCASVHHRQCDGLEFLPKFAKGILATSSKSDTQASIQSILKDLTDIELAKKVDLRDIFRNESSVLQDINDFRKKIHERVDEMFDGECDKIKTEFQADREPYHKMLKELEDKKGKAEKDKELLDDFHGHNESQLFCLVKTAQKNIIEARSLLNRVSATRCWSERQYKINGKVEECLSNVISLGQFDLPLVAEHDVKIKGINSNATLFGSCLLADGTVIFTDMENDRLVRIDMLNNRIEDISVPGGPWGVCTTGLSEIAITLALSSRVQIGIVKPFQLMLSKSFSVKEHCRGICHIAGKLFVAVGDFDDDKFGCVCVYLLNGALLDIIEKDSLGGRIFCVPIHLTISATGKLYVTDCKDKVVTLEQNGNVLSTFTDPHLTFPYGICPMDDKDNIIVTGYHSNNIFQIGKTGHRVLMKDIGRGPQTVLVDPTNNWLIVTSYDSYIVRVYDLSKLQTYDLSKLQKT